MPAPLPLSLPLPSSLPQKTYLIIGASRGIGLEFARQTLALGHRVIATARAVTGASQLWALTGSANGRHLTILECDVGHEASVVMFATSVERLGLGVVDVVVVNAGVLVYPGRMVDISFNDFSHHMTVNTIGPLLTAQALLKLAPALQIKTLVFMSSDSGSAAKFRAFEDGFAAYAASKAALNQGLRHLAAELSRSPKMTTAPATILALHPGEVSTDMTNISLDWDVEGIISVEESVSKMLVVIGEKGQGGVDEGGGEKGVATFWTWEGIRYPW